MSKGSELLEAKEVDLEAIPKACEPIKATLSTCKCTICGKKYDKIHEYKDCTVYYHAKDCETVLTVPKEK
jgi:hypothetical protein